MTDHLRLVFAPLLPSAIFNILLFIAVALVIYALIRRARGAVWRGIACAFLLLALANPSLIQEQRAPLKDVALMVIDDSASMRLSDRPAQAAKATEELTKKLMNFADLEVETIHIKGAAETDLYRMIDGKLASIPRDRLAGVVALTDGEIHDKAENAFSAPMHFLLAGHQKEIDRRLGIAEAPAYGIVGKTVTLTLRVDDHPEAQSENATVIFRRSDGTSQTFAMPVGREVKFEVPVDHAGQNLFAFSTEPLPHELTSINNSAAASVNGIRDRLRVLLVSGEPHIGGRTWRNFLKADPAVDLIHFTILRSPTKMDGVPNNELALIAFPVHELFDLKLDSFDLVIFDRFRRQSLIPEEYLENIAKYVEKGGALLISNATDEGIPSLTLSPLARVLPAEPTGHLLTGAFVPDLTEVGKRHPVTNSLTSEMPRSSWGPWFRQIEARAARGEVIMSGLNNAPLLILDHVGDGRVAQFLSDQFWLWSREATNETGSGGGPQAELLRRTAHWLVNEPELDETALRARVEPNDDGWQLIVTRQSLHDEKMIVIVTDPDDQSSQITLAQSSRPGILEARQQVTKTGLYHLKEDSASKQWQEVLVMVGPANAPEFGAMFTTDEKVKPVASTNGGGILWLEDYPAGPDIKRTSASGVQQGWGWIGLKKNEQYRVTGSKAYPLAPAWLAVLILLAVTMFVWRREGRS